MDKLTAHDHTTFGIKRELDFSPGCGFHPSVEQRDFTCDSGGLDMDLATFLGEPGIIDNPSELEPSEWNSLFTDGHLEELDFLDPTTGAPTSANMSDHVPFNHCTSQQPLSNGFNGQFEGNQVTSMDDGASWLLEQTQKLERQQQIQQQKLLELEQTLLRTEILKNRLEIVSSIKHASPNIQNQLLSAITSLPDRSGGVQTTPTPQLHVPTTTLAPPTTTAIRLTNGSLTPRLPIPRTTAVSQSLQTTINQQVPISSMQGGSMIDDYEVVLPGGKKKSHNLIEKKYRTSINDRIGVLRSIVSKHFRDDKKAQKSAVLQKTIDYIRYLENLNRKLKVENKQMKVLLNSQGLSCNLDSISSVSSGHSPILAGSVSTSPQSINEYSDEPSSPDVFLSDTSPSGSPPMSSSILLQSHPSTTSNARLASHMFMCFMMVVCFFVDPFSLTGGVTGTPDISHGSHRTLNWLDTSSVEGVVTLGWVVMWIFRCLIAGMCFGVTWVYSLPKRKSEWEGTRFWRLRKQAEQDIKNSEFNNAQMNLVSALTEVGLFLPTSYSSLVLSLAWNGISHLLFQLFVGRVMVSITSMIFRKGKVASESKSAPQAVGDADVAQTLHLLHQISLASYDGRSMHGLGFFLGLTALNYAEVERESISLSQWSEMLFTMGVQCQFSCACVASLLARYYFICAGNLGGLLSFVSTDDGWEYLMSKEWTRDVQVACKLYKSVAVFPKYSVSRSFCKTLLTEAYRDLLIPQHQKSHSHVSLTNANECLTTFHTVLDISRQAHAFLVEDMKQLTNNLPTLSDTMSTRDSGFEILLWWASTGLVACHWMKGEECEEHYPVIEDLPVKSSPVPTALHLAFKAQRLHRSSNSPLSVINQICMTASHSLNTCGQDMSSEDNLNLLGLLLTCDWLLSLRYSLWQENNKHPVEEETHIRQLTSGFREDVETLGHLTSFLPGAFPQLSKYKSYQRLMSGGNPIFAGMFLGSGSSHTHSLRQREVTNK